MPGENLTARWKSAPYHEEKDMSEQTIGHMIDFYVERRAIVMNQDGIVTCITAAEELLRIDTINNCLAYHEKRDLPVVEDTRNPRLLP